MEKKEKNVVEETFADDLAKIVGENETGIVRKIIEEEEKSEASDAKTSPERNKNRIFLYSSIFLVVIALGAVAAVYLFRKQSSVVQVAPQFSPLIFTDLTEFKEVTGLKKDEIIQTILNEASTANFKENGVEGIYLTLSQKVVGFRQFLNLMEANLDQTQIGFMSDNFMIGALDRGNASTLPEANNVSSPTTSPTPELDRDLFLLVKMRSVADVFEPMRIWEAKMFSDLHGLFKTDINADTAYLLTEDFTDGIIQNKNARILYDKNDNIVMMYVYIADDTLIITNSEPAVAEVIARLASGQIKS